MQKITNKTLITVFIATQQAEQLLGQMPVKLQYTISKHQRDLQKHIEDFNKARKLLQEQYADKFCESDKNLDGFELGKPIKVYKYKDRIDPESKKERLKDHLGNEVFEYQVSAENKKLLEDEIDNLLKEEVEVPDFKIKDIDEILKWEQGYDGKPIAEVFPLYKEFLLYYVE